MVYDQYDIFISYAQQDAGTTEKIVSALRAEGLVVLYPAPQGGLIEVLSSHLGDNTAHVVVWSNESAASGLIQTEARISSNKGKLIATRIQQVEVPLDTQAVAYADLRDWQEGIDHPGMKRLLGSIHQLTGKGPEHEAEAQPAVTKGYQEPERNSTEKDEHAWQVCLAHNNKTYYQYYIDYFPNGNHIEEARERLARKKRNDTILLSCAIIYVIAQTIYFLAIQP